MTRFRIDVADFVVALLQAKRSDYTQYLRFIKDWQYGDDGCYPIIDRPGAKANQ